MKFHSFARIFYNITFVAFGLVAIIKLIAGLTSINIGISGNLLSNLLIVTLFVFCVAQHLLLNSKAIIIQEQEKQISEYEKEKEKVE